jgi:hypothetical protein
MKRKRESLFAVQPFYLTFASAAEVNLIKRFVHRYLQIGDENKWTE